MAPDGSRPYVAVTVAGKVAVVDFKTLEVVGEISGGKQLYGLARPVRQWYGPLTITVELRLAPNN